VGESSYSTDDRDKAVREGEMRFWKKLFTGAPSSARTTPAPPRPSERVTAAAFLDAVANGELENVRAFLKRFPALVSVKESGGFYETPLHKAIGKGNVEMVKLLLANNADVNIPDVNHQSPLFDAVTWNNEEIVRLLLARKATVNSLNCPQEITPLHVAKSRAIAELLIAHGANIHAKTNADGGSATPLHDAARGGWREVAETLIGKGAKINERGEWGSTPLHCAVMENKQELVQLLLNNNADVSIKDQWGRSVFDIAEKKNDQKLLDLLRNRRGL
jgi:ankyrin repeat protein